MSETDSVRDQVAAAIYADAEGVDPDERQVVVDAVLAIPAIKHALVRPLMETAEQMNALPHGTMFRAQHKREPRMVFGYMADDTSDKMGRLYRGEGSYVGAEYLLREYHVTAVFVPSA